MFEKTGNILLIQLYRTDMDKCTLKLYPINYPYFMNIMFLQNTFNPNKERTDGRNHFKEGVAIPMLFSLKLLQIQ